LDFWDAKPLRPHLGPKSSYCAGIGEPVHPPYDNFMDSYFYLKSNCGISLAGYTDVTFSFWIWYDTQAPNDFARVQYYNNSTWVDFPNSHWTGNSGGWMQKVYTLTGITNFRFQFKFQSDSAGTAEGFYLDDILVTGIPAASDSTEHTCEIVDRSPPYRSTTAPAPEWLIGPGGGLPEHFGFTAIAPNPCNAVAALCFDLPAAGVTSLTVFNLTGGEIARLSEGYLTQGLHEVIFDGHRLPTGLYLVRLREGNLSDTQKLILLK
jgi:hypothetical protein